MIEWVVPNGRKGSNKGGASAQRRRLTHTESVRLLADLIRKLREANPVSKKLKVLDYGNFGSLETSVMLDSPALLGRVGCSNAEYGLAALWLVPSRPEPSGWQ